MTRVLVVPAAGAGSRLGRALPKLLVRVAGRPMLEHLLALYGGIVDFVVVVVNPAALSLVEAFLRQRPEPVGVAVQAEPTGMIDALLAAGDLVATRQPDRVWISWCDQIAIRPETAARLRAVEGDPDGADLVMPTLCGPDPYIHFVRDASGRIVGARQRREGDPMPPVGESDAGLFSLSREAFLRDLPAYAALPDAGALTRERNFIPFIPWLAATRHVRTFPCVHPMEAVGINTPEDLRRVEAHLRGEDAGRHVP